MPKELDDITKDVIDTIGEDLEEDDEQGQDDEEEEEEEPSGDEEEEEEEEDDPDASGRREEEAEFNINTRPDKKGNLVDPRTGKIIAPAGAARRFYEKAVNASHHLNSAQTEIKRQRNIMVRAGRAMEQMKNQLETFSKQESLPKQLGLSPEEHAEMLQVAAKFKNNATALDAIKYMLTRAVQRGIDIKPLGANPGAATDFSIVAKDIEDRIKTSLEPITSRLQESDRINEEQNQVRNEREEFLSVENVPDQLVTVLDHMVRMPQFQSLGYKGSWLALQNYLLKQSIRQRGTPDRSNRSRPNGRGRPGVESRDIDDSPVSADTEFGDLVRGVLRDHPLDVS